MFNICTYIGHCPPLLCVTEAFLCTRYLGTCLNAVVWGMIGSLRHVSYMCQHIEYAWL